jgi:hypothetical protein
MESEAYEKHKKDIVVFSHKEHAEDYAEKNSKLFEAGCGKCHHDEKNNPLKLNPGEDVKQCIECHKKPGRMPSKEKRGMRKAKLSRAEKKLKKLAYHAEALHYNCRDCHRSYNRKNNLKSGDKNAAPTRCNGCH